MIHLERRELIGPHRVQTVRGRGWKSDAVADCIDLGRITYNKGDYYHTVMWMEHALQQLQREKQNISEKYYNQTHAIILDYLAFATFKVSRPLLINDSTALIFSLNSAALYKVRNIPRNRISVNFA